MDKKEIDELWNLIEQVLNSTIKAEAKLPLKKLKFKASVIATEIGNNASYKLSQAIISADSGSGNVADKEHHAQRSRMHFGTFKNILENESTD